MLKRGGGFEILDLLYFNPLQVRCFLFLLNDDKLTRMILMIIQRLNLC